MERHRAAVIEKLKSSVQHEDPGIVAKRRSFIKEWAETQAELLKFLEDDLQFLCEIFQDECSWSDVKINDITIILSAFKQNKVKILEYLFNKDSKNPSKSAACRETIMLSDDYNQTYHNAFYYAIRLGNVELLDSFINKWLRNYFSISLRDLDRLISRAYDEIKLKNVFLSEKMDIFVENEILNLRFFSDDAGQYQKVKRDLSNIKERIGLVLQNISELKAEYSDTKEVDEKFLFIAKFIAQNIHVLKRQLRSTYDKLPWEEVEFCLVSFISSHIKQQDINPYYNVILNKNKLLKHLENFANKLEKEKTVLESVNILGRFADLPKLNREKVVSEIVRSYSGFEELYTDYQQIKDIHSLEKISYYIKLAVSADPKEREGQIIITRVLQVIGEYLKNTLESPNLSTTTSELLLYSLPKNTRAIIIDLRNSLSHAFSLSKRTEIEENKNASFFIGVQNDTKRINDVITDILNNNKMKMIGILLNKVSNSESIQEMKEIAVAFQKVDFNLNLDSSKLSGHNKFEKLIKKLSNIITEKTNYELELFNSLDDIINFSKKKLKNFDTDFIKAIVLLKVLAHCFKNNEADLCIIRETKYRARVILNTTFSLLEPASLKEIADLSINIFFSAMSRMEKDEFDTVSKIIQEILYIVEFETGDLNYIEKLRDNLNEKNSFTPMHKLKKSSIVPDKEMINQLESKLLELQNTLKNNALNDKLIENLPSYKKNKKLQAVIEMLVLDIMSILDLSENHLENNLLFLDDNTPLLTGKCLRNHLAHDNTLTDILLIDPSIAVILNAKKLTSENLIESNKKVGKFVEDNPVKLKDRYNQSLKTVVDQKKMFIALEKGNINDLKKFLVNGADIHARNINLSTALHFASRGPSLEIVKFLIDQKLSVNVKDSSGQSPLHVAAAHGRTDIVEFFIREVKMHVDDLNSRGKTALHIAAENGHLDVVKVLLKYKASANVTDNSGYLPLHSAIKNAQADVAMILLKEETNLNGYDAQGDDTLLHLASEKNCIEIVNYLLKNGANIHVKDDKQSTPLHTAAASGSLDVVNALILKGANVNFQSITGTTPLHHAVESGFEKIVEILLEHGAEVNTAEKSYHNTPLHYAAIYGYEKIVKILLKNKANSSLPQNLGLTPLHLAVQERHLEVVVALLEHGVDISAKVCNNATPLHYAADYGTAEIAQVLINSGSEVNVRTNEKLTPLHSAAQRNDTEIVKLLIKNKAQVEVQDLEGRTPLHAAAVNGNKDIIDLLIKNKAGVDTKSNDGSTPLYAAALSGHTDAVAFLIKSKAKVNAKTVKCFTPLHAAVIKGHRNIVELLIKNEAEVNAEVLSGNTPLHLAVQGGHKEIVRILVENGANVNANSNNFTPLILAIKQRLVEIVKILVEYGASIDEKDSESLNPLRVAVSAGYKDIVEVLVKNKACVDVKDSKNSTLLHLATQKGHKEIVNTLLTWGTDVNAVTVHNATPLHFAAQGGDEEIVEILIKNGANIDSISSEGTPIHAAAERGYDNVIEVLLSHGADVDIKDSKNRTAFECAVINGHLSIVKMLLRHKKVDLNAIYDYNRTILHIASEERKLEIVKFLVEEGSDIHAKNYLDSKPIHIAAREGYKDIVKYYLNKGLSVNELGQSNQTLLHYATINGQLEVIKYLIAIGADVNAKDINALTPLHFAAIFNFKDVAEVLLKNGAVFDAVNIDNEKFSDLTNNEDIINLFKLTGKLFESVEQNNSSEVEKYIKAGACINAKKVDSGTPLHYAARRGHDEIVKILLQNKANPDSTDSKKFTPLHYAAKFSHLKTVKALLINGAVYNPALDNGSTPLGLAVDKDVVTLLKLVNESFEKVIKNNIKVINDLKKVKDIDTIKAVMNAHNQERKTLIVAAVHNNFSKIEELKEAWQGGLSAQIDAGLQHLYQGNYQAALKILRSALEIRKEILGPNNPGTLEIQTHIASVLYKEGNYCKAMTLYEEILQKQKEILGVNDKNTLSTRSTIGLVMYRQGKYEEALTIFKEVYPKQKELLGPEHSDTFNTEFHMAMVLTSQGGYEEALNINKTMYEKKKKIFGGYDKVTVSIQNNIGLNLFELGKYEDAYKVWCEVYEIKKIVFGINHTDTLRTLQNIASVLTKQNKYVDAEKIYQEVLNIQKKDPEQFHIEILNTQYNLGGILLHQGKCISALRMYKESFEKRKLFFGPYHPSVLEISKPLEQINLILQLEGNDPADILKRLQENINNAASAGDLQTIRNLLKSGADPNDIDFEGRTPLHFAVDNGHVDIVKFLLKNGANCCLATNKGNTPLHMATSKCRMEIIEILLNHLSSDKLNNFINAKTTSGGTTSLHVAAKSGSFGIVKSLLKRGAAYDIKNKDGKTPVDISKGQDVISLLKSIEELFRDVKNGNIECITKLKTKNRDEILAVTNARNNQGNTLVKVAMSNKHKNIASELLKMLKNLD